MATQINGSAQIQSGSISDDRLAVSYVKADGTRSFTGNLAMGGNKITGLGTPTAGTDAATKAYVDSATSGLDVKQSVRLATTAALAAVTASGSGIGKTLTADANGALSVDGVATAAGNRVLIKNQATAANNGIYVVTDAGSAGTPFILTRATDADENAEITANMFVFVSEGTTNADTGWVLTTNDTITVDTTALSFAQFTATSTFTGDLNATSLGYLTDSAGDLEIVGIANNNIVVRIGDDTGSTFSVRDSNDTALFNIGSTGTINIPAAVTTLTASSTNASFGNSITFTNGSIVSGEFTGTGVSIDGNIETLNSGNISVDGTLFLTSGGDISTTSNGNINLAPNGTGEVLRDGLYLIQDSRNVWKTSVRAATTANITLSGAQTIDGVSVIAGDRVLVKDQTTGADNGIYVAAAGAWSRAADASVSAEVLPGTAAFVSEGTTNGNKVFTLTTDAPITLGTTSLTFSNLIAASSFTGDLNDTSLGKLTDTSGNVLIEGNASANVIIKLGDSAGARTLQVLDSGDATQLTVDSNGNLTVEANITGNANLDVQGNITLATAASDLTFAGGGNITTTANGTLTVAPNGTGAFNVSSGSSINLASGNNGHIDLDPNGTGTIRVLGGGLITTTSNGDLRFDTDGTGRVLIGTTYEVQDSRNPWKWPVRAATTGNITLSAPQTIDGVSVIAGDRVLVKNQTTGSENGIYVVAAGSWTRALDADNTSKMVGGTSVFVNEGTVNADTTWQLHTNNPITVGSTALTFINISTSSMPVAGDGITVSGTTVTVRASTAGSVQSITVGSGASPAGVAVLFNSNAGLEATATGVRLVVDDSTVELNTNTLRIKDAGVTFAKLATAVSDRLGRYDRIETFTGSTATTQDLAVTDVNGTAGSDSAGLLVYKNGILLSIAAGDYDFSNNTGAGGVDQLTGLTRVSSDRITVLYKRTGSAI